MHFIFLSRKYWSHKIERILYIQYKNCHELFEELSCKKLQFYMYYRNHKFMLIEIFNHAVQNAS